MYINLFKIFQRFWVCQLKYVYDFVIYFNTFSIYYPQGTGDEEALQKGENKPLVHAEVNKSNIEISVSPSLDQYVTYWNIFEFF